MTATVSKDSFGDFETIVLENTHIRAVIIIVRTEIYTHAVDTPGDLDLVASLIACDSWTNVDE